jgi:hypothetical protein
MKVVKTASSIISLVFLLLPAYSVASDQEFETEFVTRSLKGPMLNGKGWMKLDPQSKISYITGLEEGLGLLIAEIDNAAGEEINTSAALSAYERLIIRGFKMFDLVEEINRLYQEASNRKIPLVDAYRYVLKKFKGASPEELASTQSALRKRYNK